MHNFEFHRPTSVRKAASLALGEDAKLLAGGQTLLPVMKQGLAAPGALIDLSGVATLTGIELRGRTLHVGAMTCHADVAGSAVVRDAIPSLAGLAASIGDPHVRHRGTLGGSVANNDPAADYPAACLGLGAAIVTNKRRISADEFFTGMFETALEDGEIITKVLFPVPRRAAYEKFRNPASRYALVGVFISKRGRDVRVAVTGAAASVYREAAMEAALSKRFAGKSLDGMSADVARMMADIHASANYRAHLVGVMARRAAAKA